MRDYANFKAEALRNHIDNTNDKSGLLISMHQWLTYYTQINNTRMANLYREAINYIHKILQEEEKDIITDKWRDASKELPEDGRECLVVVEMPATKDVMLKDGTYSSDLETWGLEGVYFVSNVIIKYWKYKTDVELPCNIELTMY